MLLDIEATEVVVRSMAPGTMKSVFSRARVIPGKPGAILRKRLRVRRETLRKTRKKLRGLVLHPRYGDEIVPSGVQVAAEEVRGSFWRYSHETIFPETAIAADVSRQDFATFPRGYYVDILKECRECKRGFFSLRGSSGIGMRRCGFMWRRIVCFVRSAGGVSGRFGRRLSGIRGMWGGGG